MDTCDVRIQLHWEYTNSTLPSIVLGNLFRRKYVSKRTQKGINENEQIQIFLTKRLK